jgi:hypothetical protein
MVRSTLEGNQFRVNPEGWVHAEMKYDRSWDWLMTAVIYFIRLYKGRKIKN